MGCAVAPNFFDFYNIPMVEGRSFRPDETRFDRRFIVNQTALKRMDCVLGEGRRFNYGDGKQLGEIIGVVADFHFQSLHQSVAPLAVEILDEPRGLVSVKIDPRYRTETLAGLNKAWEKLGSKLPFFLCLCR